MRRFFLDPESLLADEVHLPAEVVHHAAVLRLAPGEEILLLDGEGGVCRGRIESLRRDAGRARILARWQEPETAFPVHLLQALPKGDKFDLVLQKGTELGVTRFTPVLAGRTVPHWPAGQEERRRQRWERIIREAARQCGRPCLPRLDAPVHLAAALEGCAAPLRLIPWEEESRPLAAVLGGPPASVAVLVGPEGGFGTIEVDTAHRHGFVPVSLGPRILRTETAGLAMASILQYLFGDLGRGETPPA